jgi:hypothetical protein
MNSVPAAESGIDVTQIVYATRCVRLAQRYFFQRADYHGNASDSTSHPVRQVDIYVHDFAASENEWNSLTKPITGSVSRE